MADGGARLPERRRSSRRSRLAGLLFVVATLLALWSVPYAYGQRTARLRTELSEAVDPARAAVRELTLSNALAVAGIRGFVASGDPDLLAEFHLGTAGAATARGELERLAPDLGINVRQALVEVDRASAVWGEPARALAAGERSREQHIAELELQQEAYERLLAAERSLDAALAEWLAGRRAVVARAESRGRLIAWLLAVLGLAATWLVARGHARAERAQALALADPLTGVANRRALAELLPAELARCRHSGQPLALVCVDLDGFKRINDEYGHDTGDRLLQAVAAELATRVRVIDVVARLGGDEFAVILPGLETGELGPVLARLEEGVRAAGEQVGVDARASLGAVECADSETTAETLLRAADRRMYERKRSGR